MESVISEDLRAFLAKELSVDGRRLRPERSLLHDYGVGGVDGTDLMTEFSVRFHVDISALQPDLHFGPEGGCNPVSFLYWQLLPAKRPKFVPITIADLEAALSTGIWVTPDRPAVPSW